MANDERILKAYELAKEEFASWGVDTEEALKKFDTIKMSLQCWQGDDVKGFEPVGDVGSQNVVTGSYPGAARNGEELRADIDFAAALSPFSHKINIHSCYGEFGTDRKDVTVKDFSRWIDWAKERGYGLDFNGSYFAHKMMNNGFSYASLDKATRDYWIETAKGTREISYEIGKALGEVCYNNLWIPDGLKDTPANRFRYRDVLEASLDEILAKKYDGEYFVDTLEGKLFGIGVESFTVG
ncbi:MAG: L-rhamnose isomerase, partial [Clostridia bacterium]|nr:L-rhamnose isomerase [Clostridia bacterium]